MVGFVVGDVELARDGKLGWVVCLSHRPGAAASKLSRASLESTSENTF